jgi:hypothetical protein
MLQKHCTFTFMLACTLQREAYDSVLLLLLPSLSSPLLLLMVIGDGVPYPKWNTLLRMSVENGGTS